MKREQQSQSKVNSNHPSETVPGMQSLRLERIQPDLPYTHDRIIEKLVVSEAILEEPERWDGMT